MPAPDTVIGLDIGTTSTIGIAVRMPGEIVHVASRPVSLSSPRPGWAEEDPREWWENSVAILKELVASLPGGAGSLAGLCVTGMLPAVVLIDADGEVLRPSIQQSDGRVGLEVDELKTEVDEAAFLKRTGNGVNQQLVATKLRWLAKHEPETFKRIATVFGSYDYINWRLTGRRAVEQNWALEAGFTDIATDEIAADLVALGGLPRSAVPDRTVTHETMGTVSAEAAAATGLPEGLPIFGGAADHIASALAAGIARPGDILLKFGGAGDIVVASDHAAPDSRLYLDYHLVPGVYAPNGCMAASGSALNWLAGMIGDTSGDERPHVGLDRLAAAVPAGSEGLICLPYFLGEKTPIHDPLARGTFIGLTLTHGKGHLWRSLLEAIGYGFRHHLDVLLDMGHAPKRLFASDGGTKSRVWMQMVADIVGMPLQLLDNPHGSSVGAAWVAAIGSGLSDDWSAVSRLARHGDVVVPDPANRQVYDQGYARYRAAYIALKPIFAMP
ncbi:carbohydrate kinase [Kaistia algarum]|uniref:FGGY-family carbohydrate kinase n=1 Tax=Kaistia algarum TaxID=2083279 RepID=UPI000CE8ACC1|nr:FGGY-family carbohydrate kinase [Kaistia algarum]MCX5515874.1 FGGY-family carbohydrate kinase [Kaistia algarum]PPE80760.1 carbohydrate kinase [Kaistia algarum]